MKNIVKSVDEGSIAAKKGIEAGDVISTINWEPMEDYIDYAYFMGEKKLTVEILKQNGKKKTLHIKKREGEELGITFESDGFGEKKRCRNKCLFCFVDQLPKGARSTLKIKDDDWRLSFLMGNYITLTNADINDMTRIVRRKVSPLYISVHATDDDAREKLLSNKFARGIMPLLEMLTKKGIKIHTQAVLCPGINDEAVLQKTISDLYSLSGVRTLAVVPAGLTAHREGLYPLRAVTKADAQKAIDIIEEFQREFLKKSGERFVFASDELYIRAGKPLPAYEEYEDFAQIENGVGLAAQFIDGANEAYDNFEQAAYEKVSVVTGEDFYPYIKEIAKRAGFIYNMDISVYKVENAFFGKSITVAGLLTGGDVLRRLEGEELGQAVFLPKNMFREGDTITLDDITLKEMENRLQTPCIAVEGDGYGFIEALCRRIDE